MNTVVTKLRLFTRAFVKHHLWASLYQSITPRDVKRLNSILISVMLSFNMPPR